MDPRALWFLLDDYISTFAILPSGVSIPNAFIQAPSEAMILIWRDLSVSTLKKVWKCELAPSCHIDCYIA